MASRCPECAGKMTYNPDLKCMVCNSCGLSLNRFELDNYWQKIRNQNLDNLDESERKKKRKKDWLDWYAKSKDDKQKY
ncbi:MAG: hypothetical protein JXA99_02410 [Candidatus Lokiarchaeota archaeon]|nr:hypothetical protein [Candidatus Lokiarchaeota archaeon]